MESVNSLLNYAVVALVGVVGFARITNVVLAVKEKSKKYIWLICFLKLGVWNISTISLHVPIAGGETASALWYTIANVLVIFAFIGCEKLIIGKPYGTIMVANFMTELLMLVVQTIPYFLFYYLAYGEVATYMDRPLGWNVAAAVIVAFLLLFGAEKILQKFHLNFEERTLRFPNLWLGLWLVYWLYSAMGIGKERTFYEHFLYTLIPTVLGLLLLYEFSLYYRWKAERKMQQENETLLVENSVMKEYYVTLKDQMERTKKFHHDISKHMMVLRELQQKNNWDEESALYMNDLESEFDKSIPMIFCKDPVINAVLTNKTNECQKNHIEIQVEMNAFQMGRMREIDVVALLVNMLDNAIEECLRLPEEMRKIEVASNIQEENMFLLVKNSTDKKELTEQKLKTQKPDAEAHGVGLKIMREIIERRHGNIDMSIADGMFGVLVQWNL